MNRPRWTGYLLVVLAAGFWSTGGFYAKAPVFDQWPLESRGVVLAFWRALFAASVLALFVRRIQWRWPMLAMVSCFCVMNWLYLATLVKVEASIAIWLQSTAPAWVVVAGCLMGSRIHRRDRWLIAWSITGIVVILVPQIGHSPPDGLITGLLSGVAYAGVVLSLRHLRDCDAAWLVFINHAATAILLLPFVFQFGTMPSTGQWFMLACFGAFQMGLPYLLFAKGLKQVPGHEASLIALLEPILLPFWIFLAWHSHPGYTPPAGTTLLGGFFILIGLFQRYAIRNRTLRPLPQEDPPPHPRTIEADGQA